MVLPALAGMAGVRPCRESPVSGRAGCHARRTARSTSDVILSRTKAERPADEPQRRAERYPAGSRSTDGAGMAARSCPAGRMINGRWVRDCPVLTRPAAVSTSVTVKNVTVQRARAATAARARRQPAAPCSPGKRRHRPHKARVFLRYGPDPEEDAGSPRAICGNLSAVLSIGYAPSVGRWIAPGKFGPGG